MTPQLLSDLLKIARFGAGALGQNSDAANMQRVWAVIGEAEKSLPQPAVQPATAADTNAPTTA